jgi:hypothetical protein
VVRAHPAITLHRSKHQDHFGLLSLDLDYYTIGSISAFSSTPMMAALVNIFAGCLPVARWWLWLWEIVKQRLGFILEPPVLVYL